jgi:hypothetical protein
MNPVAHVNAVIREVREHYRYVSLYCWESSRKRLSKRPWALLCVREEGIHKTLDLRSCQLRPTVLHDGGYSLRVLP